MKQKFDSWNPDIKYSNVDPFFKPQLDFWKRGPWILRSQGTVNNAMDVSDGRGRYHSFSGIDTDKTVMDNFEAPFLGLDQLNRLDLDFGSYF